MILYKIIFNLVNVVPDVLENLKVLFAVVTRLCIVITFIYHCYHRGEIFCLH